MSSPISQQPEQRQSLHGEPIARDYFSVLPQRESFEEEYNEGDIYRGEHSPTRPESISSSSSSSQTSSSSSSSSVFGGRLGAISTLVEHAIARWARARASTSSLETASTASTAPSSIVTMSRSYLSRRRRRRSSIADVHNARSEREVAARIRAREESRQIPREFVLYTPVPASERKARPRPTVHTDQRGILRTTSLQLILSELNVALKSNFRTRRAHERLGTMPPHTLPHLAGSSQPVILMPQQDYMMPYSPEEGKTPSHEAQHHRRGRKGKQRALTEPLPLSRSPLSPKADRAWWLDISSPTWEDMRAIGKLLHLHPLTLEDILQQDPREKLEVFPKLGYYFIVFRAIESQKTREKRRFMSTISTTDTRSLHYDEGIIGEVNVYLVVFREGILSFHFSDISDHTDAVRNKVLMYAQSGDVMMSSDWIAHGIMDSIVDSFFPFLDQIEKEVVNIENLVFTDEQNLSVSHDDTGSSRSSGSDTAVPDSPLSRDKDSIEMKIVTDKPELRSLPRTHFSVPNPPVLSLRRMKQVMRRLKFTLSRVDLKVKRVALTGAPTTIQRVARMRRLVTSLTRVLATKSEVVASVKKRLFMTGESGLGNGTMDDQDVFVYMGDVQDHILTLQQSLAHYERMLSQSHPTYLTHLRLSASKAKSGSDKAIVILSIISMAVLITQAVIGFNSMNIHLPHNPKPSHDYSVFGIVIAISFSVLLLYAIVVRWWWVRALKKQRRW
ncbi:hypothetical protein NM688_g704 [Phlebia brevispora]|uniref:Uncharacterized protein n=1 Tax=Phlebia brevispora TaxID=194682 RepID=A0ACC1TDD3_9APHY|nr:hypothetical protein NM688_g704 [Phlebia brevispora]